MDKFTPYYRQLLIAVTSHLAGLSTGAVTSYPIVLLQQLPHDANVSLDLDTTSWIASVHGIAGTLSILMTHLMQWKGRKFAFIINNLIIIIGWTLITFANNASIIIIGESFHGVGGNSLSVISLATISEMINPSSRSLAMLLFGISQAAGLIVVTIAGHFLHYRTVGVVMCVPIVVSLIMSLMWPESPLWLACKGDFDKCEQIFTWLRGDSEDARKELNELISAQKEAFKEKMLRKRMQRNKNCLKEFFERISKRDFYLPMSCLLLIMMTFYGSGILVTFIYGIQIVELMTGVTNSLTHIVLLDVVVAISSALAIILERRCKNKQMFLIGGVSNIILLATSCIVTYLSSAGILQKGSIVFLFCFLGSVMSNASGLSAAVFNVSIELIPVKHRGLGGAIYVITMCVLHTVSVKTAPYMFECINIWGTYVVYLIIAIIGYFLIWKFIPETKNKTLQEIEDYFNCGEYKENAKDDLAVNVPIILHHHHQAQEVHC